MPDVLACSYCGTTLDPTTVADPKAPCIACGGAKRHRRIVPDSAHIRLSPFGFQWYAKDFYLAYQKMKGGDRFSPARLTLLAQAVELAAKSLHVDQGKNSAQLVKVGHDLLKACDPTVLAAYGISISTEETRELTKMSLLNKAKAFEYFWFDWPGATPESAGLDHALRGRPGLPEEHIIEGLLLRLLSPNLR